MEKIIERVKSILLSPNDALLAVKSEEMDFRTTMKHYVAIIAAIPAVAQFIGFALIGIPLVGRQNFGRSLLFGIISYILSLVSVVVVSKVINALAPSFSAVKNDSNAFKLAVYSLTPAFVAGIFNAIPSLSVLAFLGSLYGIYILYLGLPVLMEVPEEKKVAYTVVTLLVVMVVMILVSTIAGAIAWGGGAGPGRMF